MPIGQGRAPEPNVLNSNAQHLHEDLQYSTEDIKHIQDWVKRALSPCPPIFPSPIRIQVHMLTLYSGHVETTWHCLGTCSMAPREGNSIVKHGVLDERLNVHGVKNLKVADLSICPDNVGCNTYTTALLIGEKCAMLTAEDLGYSGSALDMKVPNYHAPREIAGLSRL
jgi:alcohol oxidase